MLLCKSLGLYVEIVTSDQLKTFTEIIFCACIRGKLRQDTISEDLWASRSPVSTTSETSLTGPPRTCVHHHHNVTLDVFVLHRLVECLHGSIYVLIVAHPAAADLSVPPVSLSVKAKRRRRVKNCSCLC